MSATTPLPAYGYPFDLRWTPQDLTDAVPLRLSQLLDFDLGRDAGCGPASANGGARARRVGLMHDYLPAAAFHPRFRIR